MQIRRFDGVEVVVVKLAGGIIDMSFGPGASIKLPLKDAFQLANWLRTAVALEGGLLDEEDEDAA